MNEKDFEVAALFEKRMIDTYGMGWEEYQDERAHGPVSVIYLRRAIELVEKSGINSQIAKWEQQAKRSNAGRKRILPLSAILPLMLLHIQMGQGVVYGNIATTLHRRFKFKHFEMLGIPNVSSDQVDWYHRFWRGLKHLISLVDPYPLPLDGRMTADEYQARLHHIESGEGKTEHERNMARIDWLCNQVVLAAAKEIGGRIKSDLRFNKFLTWNTFPLPVLLERERAAMIAAGERILIAREALGDQALADMYSPQGLSPELQSAHDALDLIMDTAFGMKGGSDASELERQKILFAEYQKLALGLLEPLERADGRPKRGRSQ